MNTAKHSSKQEQADKKLTSLRRGLFVFVVLNGHLAVTKVLISIERFLAFYNYYENKNYFLTYLIAIVSIFIVSCGGSDDSPESVSPTTPEDNLPDSSKKFVGYWRNSSTLLSSCDFAFYPNGKCSRFSTSEEIIKMMDIGLSMKKPIFCQQRLGAGNGKLHSLIQIVGLV